MKIALGQLNPTIGDFEGNLRLVRKAMAARMRRRFPSKSPMVGLSWPSAIFMLVPSLGPTLPCPVADGLQSRIVKRRTKRPETRVVEHLGMDAVGEYHHAGFLLGIDPQRTTGEG